MGTAIVAFGANLGSPERTYRTLIDRLRAEPAISEVRASRLLATAPIGGPPGQPRFLNAALRIETEAPPEALLALLNRHEAELGRVRGERWGPREIDLDLLLYDDVVLENERLTLPHPRMHYRRFVLAPAAEVAAELVHPVFGRTIGELLANIDARPLCIVVTGADLATAGRFASAVGEAAKIPLADPLTAIAARCFPEFVTFAAAVLAPNLQPQLLIWLSMGEPAPPPALIESLRRRGHGVWSVAPYAQWDASVAEAAAAVAAMRPANSEWIEIATK